MVYEVVLADTAKVDVRHLYDWVTERAPGSGPEWFEELIDRLYSLERFPNRCPLAREAKGIRRSIRCLSFGKPRNVYRILFEVEQPRKTVWILHIRHSSLRDLRPENSG